MIVLGTAGNNGFIKKRLDAAKKFYGFDMDIDYSYYGGASFSELFYKTSDQYSFALHVLIGEFQKSHVGVLVGE